MDEHNIQVCHTPLESPEDIGRVEHHGAIPEAMYRRVCHETGANTKERVEPVLTQCAPVKNDTARLGGFSPSQWVLGRAPRMLPLFASEKEHASFWAQLQPDITPPDFFHCNTRLSLKLRRRMCIWTAHVGFRKHCSETLVFH